MKLNKKLASVAVAAAMAVPAMMVATPAQAGASADITVSNMYLWRGQSVSSPGAAVSGSLSYSADNGVYGGLWTSSEGAAGSHETDLFIGYSTSLGDVGVDVSFWEYMYPEAGTDADISDTDASDFVLGLSYEGFGFGAYINADSDNDDNSYYTLSYGMDKYSVTYGMWDLENPGDDYSHVTLGYSATDELSFAVSFASSGLSSGGVEEDPLFQVSYTKSFDL